MNAVIVYGMCFGVFLIFLCLLFILFYKFGFIAVFQLDTVLQ